METNFNLGSLKIVQAPLMEYFKQAIGNLESNLQLIKEEKKIPTNYESIEILNKTQKTLNMIGLNGLATVLSVSEESLIAVKNVQFDSKKNISIIEIVIHILNNSTVYVQRLINSGIDQPTKFFNDYNKLSSLLGKEVNIKDLFFPKLDLIDTIDEQIQNDLRAGIFINDNSKKNLILHLEKVHTSIQSKFLEVFKVVDSFGEFYSEEDRQAYQNICKQLYESFDYAQKLKINKSFYILFGIYKLFVCVLSPVFNEKFKSYVQEKHSSIKQNLGKSERVIARLIQNIKEMESGEKTGGIKIDDEIVKEILFEIIFAINSNNKLKEMPVYKDLETIFDIDYYEEEINNTSNEENIVYSHAKIQEIEKQFLDLKEDFNVLNNKNPEASDFTSHLNKVVNHNKKLMENVSNNKEIKSLLFQLNTSLDNIKIKKIEFNDVLQREISLALVLVDYGINGFVKNSVEDRLKRDYVNQVKLQISRLEAISENNLEKLFNLELPKLDNISQKSDEKKTFSKIFEQLNIDLIKIEETLDYFLRNDGENLEEISNIYKPLIGMKGIFSILGKEDLSKVITKISDPWKKVIDKKGTDVNIEELKESISFVSGLSLLVKAFIAENEVEAEEIYNNLMKLFYRKNKDEINNESTVPEFEQNKEKNIIVQKEEVEDFTLELPITEISPIDEIIEPEVKPLVKEIIIKTEKPTITAVNNIYTESTNDPDIAEVYLMEADEVLDNLKTSFSILDSDINNKEELTNVRRYFHTLKGSGRMVGLEFMGEAAWMVEQTMNKCLGGEIPLTKELFDAVKNMKENFEIWVNKLKEDNEVTVDLITVKKTFISLNPGLTNHVEIVLPSEEVSIETPSFTFSDPVVEEIPSEEVSIETPSFTFSDPVVEEIPSEEVSIETPSFTFSDPVVEEIPSEEASTEVPSFTFSDPVVEEVSIEEASTEVPSFTFSDPVVEEVSIEEASTEVPSFTFSDPVVEEVSIEEASTEVPSFTFSDPVVEEIPSEEVSTEVPSFTFSDPVVEEIPSEEVSTEVPSFTFSDPVVEEVSIEEASTEVPSFTFSDPVVEEIPSEEVSIETPSFSLDNLPMHIEVKNEIEDELNETLMIEGFAVSKTLYELFNEESALHIEKLKQQVHLEYNEPILLDEEFMRHAHTLASISASVHLSKIAKIAAKIENIAVVTIERNLALSQLQMNAVRHAVDNIDLFKSVNNIDHISYYDSLMKNLDSLYSELYQDDTGVEDDFDLDVKPIETIEELEEKVLETNQEEFKDLTKFKEESIKEITIAITKQNQNFIEDLINKNNQTNKLIEGLSEEVESLKQQLVKMKETQEQKEQLINKTIQIIRQDVLLIANVVKKSMEPPFKKFFKGLTGSKK